MGGGACFNGASCTFRAWNIGAFNEQGFNEYIAGGGDDDGDDRDSDRSPFREWDMTLLPYCSGDVFAGDVLDADKIRHFRG